MTGLPKSGFVYITIHIYFLIQQMRGLPMSGFVYNDSYIFFDTAYESSA